MGPEFAELLSRGESESPVAFCVVEPAPREDSVVLLSPVVNVLQREKSRVFVFHIVESIGGPLAGRRKIGEVGTLLHRRHGYPKAMYKEPPEKGMCMKMPWGCVWRRGDTGRLVRE